MFCGTARRAGAIPDITRKGTGLQPHHCAARSRGTCRPEDHQRIQRPGGGSFHVGRPVHHAALAGTPPVSSTSRRPARSTVSPGMPRATASIRLQYSLLCAIGDRRLHMSGRIVQQMIDSIGHGSPVEATNERAFTIDRNASTCGVEDAGSDNCSTTDAKQHTYFGQGRSHDLRSTHIGSIRADNPFLAQSEHSRLM